MTGLSAATVAGSVGTAANNVIGVAIDTALAFINNNSLVTALVIGAAFVFFYRKVSRWI